jgi:hypothetical protein
MRPKSNCQALHEWVRSLERHTFPFDAAKIPKDGLYVLFERAEKAHGGERLVRAGTHTGEGQLPSRLRQHFVAQNKDRSIFRKNIGRALLAKAHDAYAAVWEIDFTPAAARKAHGAKRDPQKQAQIERQVTSYMQKNFSFAVVRIDDKAKRLSLESKIISTLSHCKDCRPSRTWLGNHSSKEKIRKSGLWLVNELYKTPLSSSDLVYLSGL